MSAPILRTRLGGPVQAIAWNAECTCIAVSHCGNDVVLYEASASPSSIDGTLSWSKVATLQGHHQLVSGLDWAPKADLILSCSHDRNAFVWTRSSPGGASASGNAAAAAGTLGGGAGGAAAAASGAGGKAGTSGASAVASAPEPASTSGSGPGPGPGSSSWEKQMVITRLTKGALCVRWSPSEAKFAIGSAARVVSVGYYDPESKWWACKMIRKAHESSVVSVAWHPNSLLLATASTDRRVRLFNAYVPGYEPEAQPGLLPPGSSFGDCLLEVSHEGCGWVHAVAWSPGDESLLYASHDGAVAYVRGPQAQVASRQDGPGQLPLKCLTVVSERVAVGAGWDGMLLVLTRRSTQDPWQPTATLGEPQGSSGAGTGPATPGTSGGSGAGGGGGVVRQLAQMHLGAGGGSAAGGANAPSTSSPGTLSPSGHAACVMGLHVRRAAAAAAARGQWAVHASGPRWHVASAGLDGQVLLWDLSSFLGAV